VVLCGWAIETDCSRLEGGCPQPPRVQRVMRMCYIYSASPCLPFSPSLLLRVAVYVCDGGAYARMWQSGRSCPTVDSAGAAVLLLQHSEMVYNKLRENENDNDNDFSLLLSYSPSLLLSSSPPHPLSPSPRQRDSASLCRFYRRHRLITDNR
jgi:hypothetical protein